MTFFLIWTSKCLCSSCHLPSEWCSTSVAYLTGLEDLYSKVSVTFFKLKHILTWDFVLCVSYWHQDLELDVAEENQRFVGTHGCMAKLLYSRNTWEVPCFVMSGVGLLFDSGHQQGPGKSIRNAAGVKEDSSPAPCWLLCKVTQGQMQLFCCVQQLWMGSSHPATC